MGGYISTTASQRAQMLAAVGAADTAALYAAVPAELRVGPDGLALPAGLSELEVSRFGARLATKNTVFPTVFRGAGAYRHYIPAIVGSVTAKETFLTAYTPYQAELAQGILQSIFEYQTMICRLTGMDASNASVYDGASAAAEAVAMCRERGRAKALISAAAHPDVIETVRTYCRAAGSEPVLIPRRDGATDLDALEALLDSGTACVYLQQPAFSGVLEDAERATALAHGAGAKLILGVNPIAMAVLKTPGECGADIAVGEGQPLGMPLSFGGPYLGFMAATEALTRRLPGRIVGETADGQGRRAFVLTLQAREQHIRREKASSNICSNQALCSMVAAAYLAAMGPDGLRSAASQSMAKAHYLAARLEGAGFPRTNQCEFFHEFVTTCPVDKTGLLDYLEQNGILGGLPVDGGLLWCATELNSKEEIDRLIQLIQTYPEKGGAA